MAIHNIIFRIDFKPNYLIIDSAGKIMSLLKEMGDNFWNEFGDSPATRAITAIYKSEDQYRQITIEPTTINFTIETSKIIEAGRIESNSEYINLMKVIGLFCEVFKITDIKRAGLRTICLKSFGTNQDLKPMFAKTIENSAINSINSSLGKSNDYGIVADGEDSDKLKYHLRFGPYGKDEANKYFSFLYKEISELNYNFICDLDIYEENFALSIKPAKWSIVPITKIEKFVSSIEKSLTENLLT